MARKSAPKRDCPAQSAGFYETEKAVGAEANASAANRTLERYFLSGR